MLKCDHVFIQIPRDKIITVYAGYPRFDFNPKSRVFQATFFLQLLNRSFPTSAVIHVLLFTFLLKRNRHTGKFAGTGAFFIDDCMNLRLIDYA